MIDLRAAWNKRKRLATTSMMLPNGETGMLTLTRNESGHPNPGYSVVLRSNTINGDLVEINGKQSYRKFARGQTFKTKMDESFAMKILWVIEMKMQRFSFSHDDKSIILYCSHFRNIANEILDDFTD